MTHRSEPEIISDVLKACIKPQSGTRIMLKARLNWSMTVKYLSRMQSFGLVRVHHSLPKYSTTRKGLKFLEKMKELADLLQHTHWRARV